jgi:L-malate glycosyltransferase
MNLNKFHRKLSKDKETSLLIKIPILTFSSWLFQGMLYMDKSEQKFKIILDFIIFLPLLVLFMQYLNVFTSIFISIILSHTLNWIFNGQIFVLLKNFKLLNTPIEYFTNYLDSIKIKVENEDYIIAVAAFGSISREKLQTTSDLDIRLIRKSGIINGTKACFFVLKERTISFFNGFPLDIYVLDDINMIHKHIKNENPIIIYDPYNMFKNIN